ncbi:MAG TPA: hypothetical protein VFE88_03740 [Candidatus Nanoarchaeia archaeon]|nr:hypothetical protein [Candidatus Nanoarchaeia archaeon]
MRSLVFDSSSVISLATNDLLGTLKGLKKLFGGGFCIPAAVARELVDVPLSSHRFKLEAMMVSKLIEGGELEVHSSLEVGNLLASVNRIFSCRGASIVVVNKGEVEALALAVKIGAAAYVVDERTMRLLVEDPLRVRRILEGKLHAKVIVDKTLLKSFQDFVRGLKIIRSAELMMVAFEEGLLKEVVMSGASRRDTVDALLWGLRLRGCSISTGEIEELKRLME